MGGGVFWPYGDSASLTHVEIVPRGCACSLFSLGNLTGRDTTYAYRGNVWSPRTRICVTAGWQRPEQVECGGDLSFRLYTEDSNRLRVRMSSLARTR